MDIAVLCESLMLIIFGCSWPANIYKSLTSKTTLGKSLVFEVLVVIGYLCGITAKIIIFNRTGAMQASFWFYLADILLVCTDIVLYFRNLKIDKRMGRI
ncbi:MAG: hypothetical protein IKG17_00305 [Mogibacterium sp.]|nr:hypothetical protein [Mogibacterium sp.]